MGADSKVAGQEQVRSWLRLQRHYRGAFAQCAWLLASLHTRVGFTLCAMLPCVPWQVLLPGSYTWLVCLAQRFVRHKHACEAGAVDRAPGVCTTCCCLVRLLNAT